MNKILRIFIGKHSIISLVVTIILLDLFLVFGIFYDKIQSYVIGKHIYEIVVLAVLMEIILVVSVSILIASPCAIFNEEEAQEKVRNILKDDRSIKSVKVLSAGLSSRASFLLSILENFPSLHLEIIACFGQGSANPDKMDAGTLGNSNYLKLTHNLKDKDEEKKRLKIAKSLNIPSFRCLLLSDSCGVKYAFIGWYTYSSGNNHIHGRTNVQIFVDRQTEVGVSLLQFAEKQYRESTKAEEIKILFPEAPENGTGDISKVSA